MAGSRFVFLAVALALASLDALSTWMLVVLYTTGVDILALVNANFLLLSGVLLLVVLVYHRLVLKRAFQAGDLSLLILLLLITLVVGIGNLAISMLGGATFAPRLAISQLYGLGMPLACLAFTSLFGRDDADRVAPIMVRFAWCYAAIAFSGVLAYVILYQVGLITYFGLGTNAHYVLPWLLASKGLQVLAPLGVLILLSGKRAVLVNFVVQIAVYLSLSLLRRPLLGLALVGAGIALVAAVAEFTPLLDRFVLSLHAMSNLSDPTSVLLAFGGRGEEVIGVQRYFAAHPNHLWFGAPPGESYQWVVEASGLDVAKNYAHVTPVGLVFRHGVLATAALYGILIYLLVRYYAPRDPFYLAYVGILSSSFFGANLVVDPTSWLLIGLMLSLGPSRHRRTEGQLNGRQL